MCYLIAKDIDKIGCAAVEMNLGQHLADVKKALIDEIGYERIQLVTISRPSAYGEYEPYTFIDSEEEFKTVVRKMAKG